MFFDLPTLTARDRRAYVKFRKHLLKSGFLMLQESVYCKLAPNTTVAHSIMGNIRQQSPTDGLIQMMLITEKQFARIEYVIGERQNIILDNDKRLVII